MANIWKLVAPFDLLDAATSRHLSALCEQFAQFKREEKTSFHVVYKIHGRHMGEISLRKLGENLTELATSDPPGFYILDLTPDQVEEELKRWEMPSLSDSEKRQKWDELFARETVHQNQKEAQHRVIVTALVGRLKGDGLFMPVTDSERAAKANEAQGTSTSISNTSGGVNASTESGQVTVGADIIGRDKISAGGDVVGRDKNIEAETYIEHLEVKQTYYSPSPLPGASSQVAPSPVLSSPPGEPAPLARASGSPFVVGRPLRANERIFGRDAAFRFIAGELAKFSSVNVVGERRMGKTSLLNHLMGNPDKYLISQPDQPPLVLARVDLQAGKLNAVRFYGLALRELLAHLPASRSAEARALDRLRERLNEKPEATYDEFERVLSQLRDRRGISVRPVFFVDEVEHLLDPSARANFPYPEFFNGLRALITAELLAMLVASRRPLAEYFTTRPGSLTSTFPTYLTPFTLEWLEDQAADALLLQPSDRPLTLAEAAEARRWAGGHPCRLQVAGEAWYEAKAEGYSSKWVYERRETLKRQNCMVSLSATEKHVSRPGSLRRALRALFWAMPLSIGRLAQRLGARIDDMAAWIIGVAVLVLIVLLLLGVVTSGDMWNALRKWLGL